MSARKTEELVRKCFGQGCVSCSAFDYRNFARHCRRFVKLENKGKPRLLDMSDIEFENRGNKQKGTNDGRTK